MRIKNPRLSIGLPVYNGERYVGEAIESFLAQTMGDFEMVICDNASTDATEQICRGYAEHDRRIRYHRNPHNIGANGNFNRVAHLAIAEYFKWAAADDRCAPTYLAACLEQLEKDKTSALCHSLTGLIDARGRDVISEMPPRQLSYIAPIDPPRHLDSLSPVGRLYQVLLRTRWCFEIFGVVRRTMLLATGLQGNYYGSDKVVLASLALMGPFHEVPEVLFYRRCHPLQSTSLISAQARQEWSCPTVPKTVFIPQWSCIRGYAHAVQSIPMFPFERAACRLLLARYILQFRKIGGLAESVLAGLYADPAPVLSRPSAVAADRNHAIS